MKGKNSETGTHCGDNFEIKTYHNNEFNSNIRDYMARLCNTLGNALSAATKLPKAIVIIMDDDLIHDANINNFGMSIVYGRIVHYLMCEFNKLVSTKKDKMPMKAVHPNYPHLLWINPLPHDLFGNNNQWYKLSKALDNTVVLYKNMWSLKLKKIWNAVDTSLYVKDANRFTATGLMTYWMAVDLPSSSGTQPWIIVWLWRNTNSQNNRHPAQKMHGSTHNHLTDTKIEQRIQK